MKNIPLVLGCVADDFTGASDAASFLVNQGIPAMLFNGLPGDEELNNCAAVVVALKSRNAPAQEAVRDTLHAFDFLDKRGVKQFYIKYCSTFDSTPKGNIGPTIDAVMDKYNLPYTVLLPSLPVNKRTVKDGVLYVESLPLGESHMKNHPLNPMWASALPELMKPQGKYPCHVLNAEDMGRPKEEILARVSERCYIAPDYTVDADGERIVEVFGALKLLTGGSGILAHMAKSYKDKYGLEDAAIVTSSCAGKGIAISGSCSEATKAQIQAYQDSGGAVMFVDPDKIDAQAIWNFVQAHSEPLIYSRRSEGPTDENVSRRLEEVFSEIGRRAFDAGYTRFILAGGETSGAVCLALNFDSFYIGESVAPGVPIMVPAKRDDVRLVLKSGNFGQTDFFKCAFKQTGQGGN